jgi:hypothetical protein
MPEFTAEAPQQFDPLPEGDYQLVITKIQKDVASERAKNPGAPMWRVIYDVEGTNRKVFDNLVFVPKSFWKISSWWRALGHAIAAGQNVDSGEPEDHIGASLKAHLQTRDWGGVQQNEIAYFIEPNSPAPQPTRGEAASSRSPVAAQTGDPADVPF